MDLLHELRKIEQEFIVALRPDRGDGDGTLGRLAGVLGSDTITQSMNSVHPSELPAVRQILHSIHAVASGLDQFTSLSTSLIGSNRVLVQQTLASRGPDGFSIAPGIESQEGASLRGTNRAAEEEMAKPYRMWFLDNFAWPYPESSERVRLLAQVPSHGRAQLSNWFVNSRRRSGWSRLAKKYTNGDRNTIAAFLRKIDSGNATEEEVEDVEKCKAHFMDKGNMLVRDGIEEVLTAASKGPLTDGCVPPSKMARSRILPIKFEDPGNLVLSKKRGRIEDVEDPPSSPCSKRSTSGSWTDSSGVLSTDTGETSASTTSDLTTPRRRSARVPRSTAATSLRLNTMAAPSTPTRRAPIVPNRRPQSPHIRSFSSPLSSPTSGRFTWSRPTYRAVSSSFTIEQPNRAGELALPPPPFQITSNKHFATLATETWSNLSPWLNFEVDLNAI